MPKNGHHELTIPAARSVSVGLRMGLDSEPSEASSDGNPFARGERMETGVKGHMIGEEGYPRRWA